MLNRNDVERGPQEASEPQIQITPASAPFAGNAREEHPTPVNPVDPSMGRDVTQQNSPVRGMAKPSHFA